MPYRWTHDPEETHLTLWPHQSLSRQGFVLFIGTTTAMAAIPLLSVLGSPVVWVLLGFFVVAFWGVWTAIAANRRNLSIHETLSLTNERLHLAHVPPEGPALEWESNPHWVTIQIRTDGPVEKYLTLRGGGREVELGAFLTPEEREALFEDLKRALAR